MAATLTLLALSVSGASLGVTTLTASAASHLKSGALAPSFQSRPVFTRSNVNSGTVTSSARQLPSAPRHGQKATTAGVNTAKDPPAIPSVSCPGASCDTISTASGAAITQPIGLAATANGRLFHEDIEPPDQGLCAGHGFAMEIINIGELEVFNGTTLAPRSDSVTTLDSVMDLAAHGSGGWSSAGDIQCLYDPDNGGHWFITEIVSTDSEASGGPFNPTAGCFFGIADACREGLAVSVTNNPLGLYNTYFVDPNTVNPSDPGAPSLLNDYAKTATTADAFLMFYDEFNLTSSKPNCPAFGCEFFNGAQQLAFQKSALETGTTANMVQENMGTDPSIQPTDGNCFDNGLTCWYQVIPAQSPPEDSEFDNNNGGTGFMVATLDFNSFNFGTGTGDSRAAVFYWTGLSNLNSAGCSSCSSIAFGHTLFTDQNSYFDNGQGCAASTGSAPCGLAAQKAGLLDLGKWCKKFGLAPREPCAEQGIATNGDGTTQASYADGHIWFAISTLVNEQFAGKGEFHVGGAYWVVSPNDASTAPAPTVTSQGYIAAAHEDIEFPTLVGGAAGSNEAGNGLVSFTLSGNGGPTGADGGGFFPSSAFGRVTTTSGGLVGNLVHVADIGQAPQDGFTEYQILVPGTTIIRPRWGDYGAAVYVPGVGFYFSSEYIQYPNCNPAVFLKKDFTCGGTRDPFANFGTSVNLTP